MNLQHIEYFVELAHTHSFTAAAQRLNITQPNLSYAIGRLEEELEVPLFEKNGRNNVLTTYGHEFLTYAERMLKTLNTGIDAVQNTAAGKMTIRIGALSYLCTRYIPRMVRAYQKSHPEHPVEFLFETGSTRTLLDGLNEGRYDIIFCAPSREVAFSSLPIADQKLVLIVPENHRFADKTEITLEETGDENYILYPSGSGMRKVIERYFVKAGFRPKIKFEVVEDQVIAGFVAEEFGVGILPDSEILNNFPIKKIRISDPEMERKIVMLWDSNAYMAPKIRDFVRYVKTETLMKKVSEKQDATLI